METIAPKTLKQIQDEVCKEYGYESIEDLHKSNTFSYDLRTLTILNEACERAQLEACKATLEKVRKNPLIGPESNIIIIK